jgi:hypothetical protein
MCTERLRDFDARADGMFGTLAVWLGFFVSAL